MSRESPRGSRGRLAALVGLVALVAAISLAVGIGESREAAERATQAPARASTADPAPLEPGTLAFRHTGRDREYGVVATVPVDDPEGPRAFTGLVCDRVDAVSGRGTCLHTGGAMSTGTEVTDVDRQWRVTHTSEVIGVPSRTRLSADGSLAGRTVFVAGHSYMATGFSTVTTVRRFGTDGGVNLERFTLRDDGRAITPSDRNLWGVTFVDDRHFYVTVEWDDVTHLARGDLEARTLNVVADDVECPSLSPDGTRIAFKEATKRAGADWWTPAVIDLASGRRTVLDRESRLVDDQIAWLDDTTLLYGLPRDGDAAVTDVWALSTDGTSDPALFLREAWSPAVVR